MFESKKGSGNDLKCIVVCTFKFYIFRSEDLGYFVSKYLYVSNLSPLSLDDSRNPFRFSSLLHSFSSAPVLETNGYISLIINVPKSPLWLRKHGNAILSDEKMLLFRSMPYYLQPSITVLNSSLLSKFFIHAPKYGERVKVHLHRRYATSFLSNSPCVFIIVFFLFP